jgi:hypothetical protein
VPEEREAPEARQLLGPADRVVGRHRLAETFDLGRGDRLVEAKCRRETDRVQRSVRQPVAAPERLRHRVCKAQAGASESCARVHCAFEQSTATFDVFQVGEHEWQRGRDDVRALQSLFVGDVVPPLDVERFGAMSERVHRGAARFLNRKAQCQLRLVDDAGEVRAGASRLDATLFVADAEARSPLGPGVGRGHGEDG